MTKKHLRVSLVANMALLSLLLIGGFAYGHDPLRDGQPGEYQPGNDQPGNDQPRDHRNRHVDRHNDGNRAEHHEDLPKGVDLAKIRALVTLFRKSGDDRHLDDAWKLLSAILAEPLLDPDVLIAASFVAQSRHDFKHAVDLIGRALAINRNNDEGWLLLASIQLVLGDSESAAMACRHLRNVPPVVLLTCKARVALATGDHETAVGQLHDILEIPDSKYLSPDMLAWSYSVAGDLAVAAGNSDQAITSYRQSLALAERTQVRAALVDVLLSEVEDETAWRALDEGSQALPLLVRRLIVAKRLGRTDETRPKLLQVQQEFGRWIANEDWLHAREMARFYIDVIDQPVLARRLALINIDLQKEPEDRRLERRTRIRQAVSSVSAGI